MCELKTSPGKMRVFRACGGRAINIKLQVCDDWIVELLGMFALIGTCDACLSLHGAAADTKLILHPESRITVSSVGALVVAGVQSEDNAK
jgi:hypothetical protein